MNILKILFGNGHKTKLLDVKEVVHQPEVDKMNEKVERDARRGDEKMQMVLEEARKGRIHIDNVIAIALGNDSIKDTNE